MSPYRANYFSCKTGCTCSDKKLSDMQVNDTIGELEWLNSCDNSLLTLLHAHITPEIPLSPRTIGTVENCIKKMNDIQFCSKVLDILKIHNRFHPPCKKGMPDYYEKIFLDHKPEKDKEISKYYFKNVVNDIEENIYKVYQSKENCCIRNLYSSVHKEEYKTLSSTRTKRVKLDKPAGLKVRNTNLKALSPLPDDPLVALIRTYALAKDFSEIPMFNKQKNENLMDKGDSLFGILDWMLDILEHDLYDNSSSKSWPLIAAVAWQDDLSSVGTVNNHCRQIFDLFKNCPSKHKYILARYISLLSEVVKISEDHCQDTHIPQFGSKCERFSEELSKFISNDLSDDEVIEMVELLSPDWLKYIVTNYLLEASLTSDTIYSLKSAYQLLQRRLTNREYRQPVANPNKVVNDDKIQKRTKNVNKRNHIGETSVHKLCRKNNYEKLEELIQCADVDVNIKDNSGWSALHEAVRCNSIDCIQILIKNRCPSSHGDNELNINIRSSDGSTPLMVAVKTRNIDIINLLLMHGAAPALYTRCNSGQTALDLAEGDEQITTLLLTAWNLTTSTYEYLNMTDGELKIFFNLVSSYFKTYLKTNTVSELNNVCAKLNEDCLYLDRLRTLVDRLVQKRANVSLKLLSVILNSKLNQLNLS